MAIVMAQLGGIGVLHRNLDIDEQVAAVRAVKRFESGMVVNPITIAPERDAGRGPGADERVTRSAAFRWSRQSGKLVGILTNRDVRFAGNPRQPVAELMTHENLAHASRQASARRKRGACSTSAGSRSCSVVDDAYRCIGLITVKDIEKAVTYPNATKDATGRLRVAAATTVGDKGFERTEAAGRCGTRSSSSSTPRTATNSDGRRVRSSG